MRKIISIIFSLALFILFTSCSAQVQNEVSNSSENISNNPISKNDGNAIKQAKIEIKGVELGASFQKVAERIGKPLKTIKEGENPCGDKKLSLQYEGLKFDLDGTGGNENFKVVYIEVRSPRWQIDSGIKIGSGIKDVETAYGQKLVEKNTDSDKILNYMDTDGETKFYFENDKLVKIERILNLC